MRGGVSDLRDLLWVHTDLPRECVDRALLATSGSLRPALAYAFGFRVLGGGHERGTGKKSPATASEGRRSLAERAGPEITRTDGPNLCGSNTGLSASGGGKDSGDGPRAGSEAPEKAEERDHRELPRPGGASWSPGRSQRGPPCPGSSRRQDNRGSQQAQDCVPAPEPALRTGRVPGTVTAPLPSATTSCAGATCRLRLSGPARRPAGCRVATASPLSDVHAPPP